MTHQQFNKFMDSMIEQYVKGVMCKKSAEYARGDDKLYNFKRSAQVDGISPIEALRGMDLKHRTSISDMLDDLEKDTTHSKELWNEKISDHINYMFLLWALLYEKNKWEIK